MPAGKNDKTEAVLLRAHHEKARFFAKDNIARKMEGSKKKGRPNMSWTNSMKEATGRSPQELRRAVEDLSLIHI